MAGIENGKLIRPLGAALAVLALALVSSGCGSARSGDDALLVVATTSIVGDIASNVIGEAGEVEVLIPRGTDAHDFTPSAQQASRIARADLVVSNGLGLEAGLDRVLTSAAGDGVEVLELAPLVDPLPFSSEATGLDGAADGELDPHFWMDPIRVGVAAQAIAERLAVADGDGPWEANAADYGTAMQDLDEEIEEVLAPIPLEQRRIVTNHEAFGYFANRYSFEVLGVIISGGSTLANPSSAQLAELVRVMEEEGVRVIFAEASQPAALAEAVAAELGDEVEVVELYTESLGETGSGAETLSGMLLTNAGRIASALAG